MKILFVPTLNAPVVHYRMANFIPTLRELGNEVAFTYWDQAYTGTCQWERELRADGVETEFIKEIDGLCGVADVVVFQIIHTRAGLALFLALQDKYSKKSFLLECDDDIYTVSSDSLAHKHIGPGTPAEIFGDEQVIKANGLIVSTDYLKKRYKKKNNKVTLIPNCIDFSIWDNLNEPKKKKKKGIVKIGWEGGGQHKSNLRLIKNVVFKILKKYPNVVFHFKFGGYPIDYLKHKRIIFEDYYKWVGVDKWAQTFKDAQFDINLAPMRDTDFNRCKSNLRWLEAAALKIPTVASAVEPYRCIAHGRNGMLANSEDSWCQCLAKLIESEELRRHIGENAYEHIKENYNVKGVSKRYIRALEGFI